MTVFKSHKSSVKDFTLESVKHFSGLQSSSDNIITDTFALVTNPGSIIGGFLGVGNVYRVGESRLVFITSGTAHVSINMEERHLQAGDVMMEESGAMVEPHQISLDFDVVALAFKQPVSGLRALYARPSEADWEEMMALCSLLQRIASHQPFREDVVTHLLRALVSLVVAVSSHSTLHTAAMDNRPQRLFRTFRGLATTYAATERTLAFYADRLCVSTHYLGEVVKKVSGNTPFYWINRATVIHACLLLHTHRELSIADVAYALRFPSSTVFCNFFRRHTGLTPGAYRRQSLTEG